MTGVQTCALPISELFFTDCLWPDFGEAEIDAALAAFAQRDRRFGGIQSPTVAPEGL